MRPMDPSKSVYRPCSAEGGVWAVPADFGTVATTVTPNSTQFGAIFGREGAPTIVIACHSTIRLHSLKS
jgi:hypothetical protein